MKIDQVTKGVSLKRSVENGTKEQQKIVQAILSDVRNRGNQAICEYTKKFDQVDLSTFKVDEEEMKQAYAVLDKEIISIMKEAAENIRDFHLRQKHESWMTMKEDGTILGQKITPLDSVGVYVPGGTAAYPSSVFMNVIPAQVAGIKRIVITSPPKKNGMLPPGVLVAADILGINEIYKIGGAQAIAALAYGTETVYPVDKIVGPGNIFVALAKREVFGVVAIDMIAGPSEIVVLADESANPVEVAADLLSQAEHDKRASSILVTTSMRFAEHVAKDVDMQLQTLPRQDIARSAIETYGHIYVADNLQAAIDVVNELAPEHLEIQTKDALSVVGKVRHAGAIFVGSFSSEPIGDYFAGPNHVLPTNGTARFSSPLNVDDFMKKSSVIFYSGQAFTENAKKVAAFARLEGLEAHARAVETRLKKEGGKK